MRSAVLSILFSALLPAIVCAQSDEDLRNAGGNPAEILTYGMSYSQRRFSPLTQINRQTVKQLVPAWSYSMASNVGEESQPLVKDGVIYITSHDKTVAIDALTGKEIWKTLIDYPPETARVVCCGSVNRGAAMYQGRLFRTTLDGRVIALDTATGKEIWSVNSADAKDGIAMTGAPLVASGVVINGMAGGEFGSRGFLEGHDPETGKSLWRWYTVPRAGEPGAETWPDNAAAASGGSTWTTGSYDPELDLVFWGIGNPAPWNPLLRKGDNLYTNSIVALRPRTGELVWHYQTSPNDPFDYDGVNALVQAEISVGGTTRKVVMQASRNGFFYVLERATGKLIAANKFVKVTWANGIDLETGRPVWTEPTAQAINAPATITTYPNVAGGTNWFPMSYSPQTGLVYVNTINAGMIYETGPIDAIRNLKPGQPHYGVKVKHVFDDPDHRGFLKAIDPLTGKSKWEIGFKSPNWAGTLATAGGLVFTGTLTGEFIAVNASTGEILWQFQTPSGIIGQPVTWEHDGTQYVTVTSGIGGVYALKIPDANLVHVPAGGSLWTFKLWGEARRGREHGR